ECVTLVSTAGFYSRRRWPTSAGGRRRTGVDHPSDRAASTDASPLPPGSRASLALSRSARARLEIQVKANRFVDELHRVVRQANHRRTDEALFADRPDLTGLDLARSLQLGLEEHLERIDTVDPASYRQD